MLFHGQMPALRNGSVLTRKGWLIGEMAVLYGGLPLLALALAKYAALPLVVVIGLALLLLVAWLHFLPGFSWRDMWCTPVRRAEWWRILGWFAILGTSLTLYAHLWGPVPLSYMPRERTGLWLLILLVYPLLSVQAQEIMYRVFFFRRYAVLFRSRPAMGLVVNGLLFGYAHLIFENWLAVLLTGGGGLLFSWRYQRSGSYWAVVLEHSLYGCLIFTVGLGQYFHTQALLRL